MKKMNNKLKLVNVSYFETERVCENENKRIKVIKYNNKAKR